MTSLEQAVSAKGEIKELLRNISGISAIGLAWDAKGEPCVRVNVSSRLSWSDRQKIPAQIAGVGVQVEEVGSVTLEASQAHR